jgi:phage protein D
MGLYPTYAPEFEILLNDEPIPASLRGCIASVRYEDGIEGADRVELSVANPSLVWLDSDLLSVDTKFTLRIGYAPDPLEEVFVGEITGVEADFPSSGLPTLRVTAQDYLNRLQHGQKTRAFRLDIPSVGNFPLPDVAVAGIVSLTNLLIPDPDPIGGALSVLATLAAYIAFPQVAQSAVRIQESQSDFDFLTQVAKENGWEVFIDHTVKPRGSVLKFQFLVQDYSSSLTLNWGSSLIEFSPRLTTIGDIFGASVRVWVEMLQMEFVIFLGWDYDRASFNLIVYPSLIGEADEILGPVAEGKVVSLQSSSYVLASRDLLSEILPRLNNRLTATGSAVGNPAIKATTVVRFSGLGDQFGGLYRIVSATHTIDGSGYRTNFQARKEVWFGSIPLPKSPSKLLRMQGAFSV